MTKIVIVGGVAGGASAAARARRLSEDAEIIMFERGPPFVSFANCGLPYHIGGDITERSNLLLQTPESFLSRFNVDVRVMSEVTCIDREQKQIRIKNSWTIASTVKAMTFCCLAPPVPVQLFRQSLELITRLPTRCAISLTWIKSLKPCR